jgi:hypothetical protein
MPGKFVTVMSFHLPYEAELARGLLEAEGITAFLAGDVAGSVLAGTGVVGEVHLQVDEADAQRAAGILAACQAEAALDEDWETQAERGAGVWVCSLCGTPVSNHLPVCYSCATPRDAIRAEPRPATGVQQEPGAPSGREGAQRDDRVTAEPGPSLPLAPSTPPGEVGTESYEPPAELDVGDDLARRAFRASLLGIAGAGLLLPISWYYLARVLAGDRALSPAGWRHLYGALAINGLVLVFWLLVCVALGVR